MIGNNSCGTHSLIAGKTVDNVHELTILLYDGTELTVGATSEAELDAIVREGGRRGEIYAALRSIRDRYLERIRERLSADSAPRLRLQPRSAASGKRLPRRARARRHPKARARSCSGATLRLIDSPQHRTLVGLGYPDSFAAADHVPAILESSPIGLEGFEGGIIDGLKHKGAPNLELLPAGRGILLVEYGSNDPAESRASAQRARGEAVASARRSADADLHRGRSQGRLEDSRVGSARGIGGSRIAAALGRLGRCVGRAREARAVPARAARAARRIQLSGGVLRALRPRLHSHAGELRLRDRAGHPASTRSSSIAAPISSSATADRFRASMATDSRAARCCRRCSAPS